MHMNTWIAVAVILMAPAIASAQQNGKVLMLLNEAPSVDLQLMLTKEVGVMKSLLQTAGFKVVVSTGSGKSLVAQSETLKPDLKFSDVKVADYKGVIIPCMAAKAAPLSPEGDAIIKEAAVKGLPLAAQYGSVVLLWRAGVLAGKKYALAKESQFAGTLTGAIYSGEEGVVQDGIIITSGLCPLVAAFTGPARPDGTSKLTEALIDELKK
jgi:hypothetical protein